LGVLLFALVTGTFPFKANTVKNLHKIIKKGKFGIPIFVSEEC